ncbi:MAG: DUF3592 domain-containing protein [Vicinamibacteraceae bacterium]
MLLDLLGTTVLAALGVLLWLMAWRGWRKRVAMRRWPRTPASIRGHRTCVSGRSLTVDVEVSYRHEGRDYTVWSGSPTGSGYGRGAVQAERQVATIFPVGSSHPVYVNPMRADEAFLVLPELHMLAVLVGSGVILVGLATALILPVVTAIDQELATLGFMTLLGVVLTVLVIFLGAALARTPRPRRR